MKVQYGDACLSLQQVYEWSRKFMNGISSVTDSPWPGQAHRIVTPEAIAVVEAIVKENRCVAVNEIAAHLDVSHGSVYHIVHEVIVYLLCSVNYEIKKFKVFVWLTLVSVPNDVILCRGGTKRDTQQENCYTKHAVTNIFPVTATQGFALECVVRVLNELCSKFLQKEMKGVSCLA